MFKFHFFKIIFNYFLHFLCTFSIDILLESVTIIALCLIYPIFKGKLARNPTSL